jgi:hypothetical protein
MARNRLGRLTLFYIFDVSRFDTKHAGPFHLSAECTTAFVRLPKLHQAPWWKKGQGSRAECSVVRCISKDGRAVFNIAGNKYRIVVWIKRPPTMAMAWKLHKGLGIPAESLIKQAA